MNTHKVIWEDTIKSTIHNHYARKNKTVPPFIKAQTFLNILRSAKINIDQVDASNNSLINHVAFELFEKQFSYMHYFTNEDKKTLLDSLLEISKNPLQKNQHGEHFLWSVSFSDFTALDNTDIYHYTKKYNIDIGETNAYRETLLNRALVAKDDLLVKYYYHQELKLGEDPFRCFLGYCFEPSAYQFPNVKSCFHKLITKERLFSAENLYLSSSWINSTHEERKMCEHFMYILLTLENTNFAYEPEDYNNLAVFLEKIKELFAQNSVYYLGTNYEKIIPLCTQMQKKFLDITLAPQKLTSKIMKI